MASPGLSSALSSTWQGYRRWALTARGLKTDLDRWRLWTLILAVAGATLATLGQQLGTLGGGDEATARLAAKAVGLAGAAAIAVSAYFAREALSNENVQRWTKSRSAAESLKAAIYLYRAGIPPFDAGNRDENLIDRRETLENALEGIEVQEDQTQEAQPDLAPMSVDEYIQQRVNDQIGFYHQRSEQYQRNTRALRLIVFWLGAVSVVLGVISAKQAVLAGWTAVIATIIAAVSSYVQSQHYQALTATYQATARRLRILRDKREMSDKGDSSRNAFIQSCEDTMALENGGWVTQWSQQTPSK
jgi:SMODS and SLOG-associating 2TM effector domain 1/Protein of unknown function (DUF4231)